MTYADNTFLCFWPLLCLFRKFFAPLCFLVIFVGFWAIYFNNTITDGVAPQRTQKWLDLVDGLDPTRKIVLLEHLDSRIVSQTLPEAQRTLKLNEL